VVKCSEVLQSCGVLLFFYFFIVVYMVAFFVLLLFNFVGYVVLLCSVYSVLSSAYSVFILPTGILRLP